MDVLVPDMRSEEARSVGRALQEAGHVVHSCARDDGAVGCASLAGRDCPFDDVPVDVVVDVPNADPFATTYGNGALCALQRRVPLVVTEGDHPLGPWASARLAGDPAAVVEGLMAEPLQGHTAAASKALLHELRGHGRPSTAATVAVTRRPGTLCVDIRTAPAITRTEGERLAVRLAQELRRYDRHAPKLDVTVHTDEALAG
ncbi:MAG: hypothetical protein ACYDA2_10985 [Acidimicrobiales bacterium]